MNPILRIFFYPFFLPSGLLTAVIIYGLQREGLPTQIQPLLEILPFAVILIALLLGWRFNRTRLIYAVGLLLLVEFVSVYAPLGWNRNLVTQVLQLLLPINLFLVCLFHERGLLHLRSLFWLFFLSAELLGCAWLLMTKPVLLDYWLNYQLIDLATTSLQLSQPLLLVHGLVLLLFIGRFIYKSAAFEASFFWVQLLLMIGFSYPGAQPLQLYLAGAGLILILGIMESSHSLAYRDELTGLPGRRALNEALAKLGNRYTLAMLDIDHFKKFNDTHGHDVGDQVLRMVAGRLATIAGGGKVFRYGGEEFTVIFARKSLKATLPYLEQLRVAVEDARFVPRGKDRPQKKPKKRTAGSGKAATGLRVTISIGAAERSADLSRCDEVINAADQALYRAKKAGRNQVVG